MENEENKAIWPDDAVRIDKPSRETPVMTVDPRTKKMAKIDYGTLVDAARESLEITTVEMSPLEGGKYIEYPTIIEDGPAGQKRTAKAGPGFYQIGDEVVELEPYFEWKYWWDGAEGHLLNMGPLPQVPVINNLTSTSTQDALAANQGKVLDEKKVDKVAGKSLILDTLITKLTALYDKAALDALLSDINNLIIGLEADKVDKETGKSLVLNTLITKLNEDFTKQQIIDMFADADGDLQAAMAAIGTLREDVTPAIEFTNFLKPVIQTDGDGKSYLSNDGTYKKSQGGGFYNVTTQHPLPAGQSYNLATASAAVKASGSFSLNSEVLGLIITFKSPEGWIDYRFIGATIDQLNDISKWEPYTDTTSLKGIRLNGEELPMDSANKVDISVNLDVDQTIDPNSTNAVSGGAVAAEFAGLSSKYIAALQLNEIGEDDEKVFSISGLDEDGNVISTTAEFSGGGGGGSGPATTKIVLSKNTENPTVKQGDDVVLEAYFDHRDTATDTSTGLPAKVTVTVISGATSQVMEYTWAADTYNRLNVTKLLQVGVNTVRVRTEVDTGGETPQVSSVSWRVQVITLRLTSSFDFATLFSKGATISLPYNLTGSGAKTLRLLVDGVQVDERTITSSSSNGAFTILTNNMIHGSHSLQMVAELEVSPTVILNSNSIYFDVAITESGKMTPIVATRFDYADGTVIGAGQRPILKARQFEQYTVRYAGYNPAIGQDTINVSVAGSQIASIVSPFVQRAVTGRMVTPGAYTGNIKIAGTTYTFGVQIAESDMDFDEPTDNLKLKLTSIGRTNSDVDRGNWTYGAITTTFTNVQFAGDGWVNNALRLMNNGRAVINYEPLNLNNAAARLNAFTFQCKFKVSDVTDVTKKLISCMNGGIGFEITSEEARMVTSGNSEVVMKFASGREYNVAFVSMPVADPATASDYEKENSGMLYLFIDGILTGIAQRGEGDNIYQTGTPARITMQGDSATLDVYTVRAYNNYLTADQVLDIYMLDLNSVEEIIAKYESNAVIDAEGDVTVESLPVGMRYVIVTGAQANGMSTVKYAAAINNKETRYDVDEILNIVKGGDPQLNWVCKGGCIRLQGTSSLAYPIKNYRIYFRSAGSSSTFGQVYLGCNEQGVGGTLIPDAKPKVSFRLANPATGKRPAPVNVWCLKADFAESSSSHNTGMAKMTNDIFIKSGSPTPAQKKVSSAYPYDVRTAVDGEPCYLFARNTITDKPIFIGKYNFNNDKSTEEVFGFRDVPGYHDAPWVNSVFGGQNPTECWEVLNNDFPMGSYLDVNFDALNADGTPAWNKVWEARFPDNQGDYDDGILGKPVHLERWCKWVNSTNGNVAKFRNELPLYADVQHLCKYFAFTQLLGAVDQMVKNAMLAFWYDPDAQRMLAYYIFYDGDTILGVRNDGRLKYSWDITRQSLDPELTASAGKPVYAYMGHESILWNNLEAEFQAEIEVAYKAMRAQMTNDYIFNVFGKEQSEKFAERIFNLDAKFKYVEPATLGITVINNGTEVNTKYSFLEAAQGSRASHRRWWLENRLDLFDARYSTGQYTLTDITWKGISDAGAKVRAIMARDYYVEFRRESQPMKKGFAAKNTEWTYTYAETANVGTIFHFLGGKYFKVLDVSEWGGFTDLTLPVLQSLEHLILGRATKTYTLSELVIGTKLPMLKIIDITNYTVLPSLDVSGCVKLEQIIAVGCTSLGTIRLPQGSPLNLMRLAPGLTTLSLIGLPVLANSGIVFPSGNNVTNLVVDSCPNINWQTLFTTLGSVQNIRVTGINMTGSASFLDTYKNLGGLDANGNVVSTPRLVGKFQLTTYLANELYEEYRNRFPELEIKQPEYSVLRVYEKDPTTQAAVTTPQNLYNPDNNTGYGTGNAYKPSGHFLNSIRNRHRYLGKQAVKGTMTICQLHDKNTAKFNDNVNPANATEALLEGQQGDVWVREPKYWYKGVNDYLKGVVYIAHSSNAEKPSSPALTVTKPVTKAELNSIGAITANRYVRRGFPNISDAINSNTSPYSVIRIDVGGWKKLNCTISAYNTNAAINDFCSAFTTEAGVIISEHREDGTNFTTGADYILDVPTTAKYFYITIFTDWVTNTDFKFFLSNSTNPLDWNPEWLEQKSVLISPFDTSWSNNKFRSVRTFVEAPNMDLEVYKGHLAARSFDIYDYNEDRSVGQLLYFKYGTTALREILGIPREENGNVIRNQTSSGFTVPYGMQDTETDGFTPTARFKISEGVGGAIYERSERESMLGYENLFQDIASRAVKSIYPQPIDMRFNIGGRIYQRIKRADNRTYYVQEASQVTFQTRVVWGGALDKIPMGTISGSSVTYYKDSFYVGNQGGNYEMRGSEGAFMSGWNPAYGEDVAYYKRNRLLFRGNIVEVTNVAQFKTISEAV